MRTTDKGMQNKTQKEWKEAKKTKEIYNTTKRHKKQLHKMTKRPKIQSIEYRGRQCDQKEMQNGHSDINDYKEMQTSEKETQNNHEETQNDYRCAKLLRQ